MRVEQVEAELAFAGHRGGFQAEENVEGMLPSACPGIFRPGMDVWPVTLGIRLADDEQAVRLELAETFRSEGELGVVVVGSADLPEEIQIGRHKLSVSQQQH